MGITIMVTGLVAAILSDGNFYGNILSICLVCTGWGTMAIESVADKIIKELRK